MGLPFDSISSPPLKSISRNCCLFSFITLTGGCYLSYLGLLTRIQPCCRLCQDSTLYLAIDLLFYFGKNLLLLSVWHRHKCFPVLFRKFCDYLLPKGKRASYSYRPSLADHHVRILEGRSLLLTDTNIHRCFHLAQGHHLLIMSIKKRPRTSLSSVSSDTIWHFRIWKIILCSQSCFKR